MRQETQTGENATREAYLRFATVIGLSSCSDQSLVWSNDEKSQDREDMST